MKHLDTAPESDSEFVCHTPCESCGSSDANSLYTDGHTFCFRCRTYTQADPDSASTTTTTPRMKNHGPVQIKGEAITLRKRRIQAEVCKRYGAYVDGGLQRFYYRSRTGVLLAAKVKSPDKEFHWEGSNSDDCFFGQHLFSNAGKSSEKYTHRVVIFEGEIDAMSGASAQPTWPMVSIPNGADGAKRAIQKQLEWLQSFDEVVLFFDNDPPGQAAATAAAEVLPPGKVKLAKLDPKYKDASEALQADDAAAIRAAIWNAEAWTPGGIVTGQDLLTQVTTPEPPCVHEYPWKGLQTRLHGIRYGELITVTAGSGIGKSSWCRELATGLLNKSERVGYLALEESNRRTALGLMSTSLGKAYHLGEHTAKGLKAAYDQTLADWNLFLFDGFGSYDPDVIYNRVEYLALGLDVRVVFLDHLSILLSGLAGDERRMLDITMTRLRSLVERTGITMFLVSHLKRVGDGKSHEEGGRVTLGQLRGSAAIAQLSDTVIALERDQQTGSDTVVRVLKNRFTGEVGPACNLRYDQSTCHFIEVEDTDYFSDSTPSTPPELEDF
jgi:twinkle protein